MISKDELKNLLENINSYQNGQSSSLRFMLGGNIDNDALVRGKPALLDVQEAKESSPELIPFFEILFLLSKKPEELRQKDLEILKANEKDIIVEGLDKMQAVNKDSKTLER